MKLGISNIAWNYKDRIKYYSLLKKENIRGLEIAPKIFLFNQKNFIKPNKKLLKKNLKEIKKFDLKLISMQSLLYGADNCFLFLNSKSKKNFEKRMIKIIKLAGTLEIPNLVFGSPKNRNIPKNMNFKKAEKIAIKTFLKLGKIAKENNTIISIESNPKEYGTNFLNNINQTYNFVKKINHSSIKIILDTGELIINNEVKHVKKIINKVGKFLNHVHISQPYLKDSKNFNHLVNVLKNLKKSNYNNWISIEMREPEVDKFNKISKSIKNLKKISRLV
tara:strand:+ start:15 stop:845 length:831 start_codon:yes stop_codon:yes gene_type:complete